jgi:hypothetical protein
MIFEFFRGINEFYKINPVMRLLFIPAANFGHDDAEYDSAPAYLQKLPSPEVITFQR